MGLSSFNAMRARMKAEAKALENSGAKVEVKESLPENSVIEMAEEVVEETVKESKTRKTDAEKLKKKKE